MGYFTHKANSYNENFTANKDLIESFPLTDTVYLLNFFNRP